MSRGESLQQRSVHLHPKEKLALRVMAREYGISQGELIRIGIRAVWRAHREGRLKILPPEWARKLFPTRVQRRRMR